MLFKKSIIIKFVLALLESVIWSAGIVQVLVYIYNIHGDRAFSYVNFIVFFKGVFKKQKYIKPFYEVVKSFNFTT